MILYYLLFLIIVVSLFIYYLLLPRRSIDIVITWVENTKDFQDEKAFWEQKHNYVSNNQVENKRRYQDNEELKYTLRSIVKHFPNYRYIYLVTKDGQIPAYVTKNHPKLKIVHHSEFIPHEYLPTFNSIVIECFIHRIPNLTENYIYMNDDTMFLRDLSIDFFIDPLSDKPYSLYSLDNIQYNENIVNEIDFEKYDFLQLLAYNNKILNDILVQNTFIRHDISHIPKVYNKNFDYRLEKIFKEYYIPGYETNLFDLTCASKFRKNHNLCFVSILKEYLYVYLFDSSFKKVSHLYFDSYRNDFTKLNDGFQNDFMCMNDINEQDMIRYKNCMAYLYPKKCYLEK